MKKIYLVVLIIVLSTAFLAAQTPWTGRTYCKITLDTKLMENPECSLGGGGTYPATWEKVYAHLGLCTCDVSEDVRNCSNESANQAFCFSQIIPYQSLVWQHVVGNWGDIAEDDGVGLMQTEGNGVYSIEFIIEDYFSSDDVSTELGTTSAVPSMPWNVNLGGKPYTMGMVFRNIDGSSAGRDFDCQDLFLVDILGTPQVVQSSNLEGPLFQAMSLDIHGASIEEIMTLSDNTYIFPNPAKDVFTVSYQLVKPNADVVISIYDIQGKLVMRNVLDSQISGWYNSQFSTEELQDGLYMVQISLDNYVSHTERIVISR